MGRLVSALKFDKLLVTSISSLIPSPPHLCFLCGVLVHFNLSLFAGTVEKMNVVETLCEDTIIFHHLHKRVWPSTQRETVFCSHLCTLVDTPKPENSVGHTWMVCNFSVDVPSVPVSTLLQKGVLSAVHTADNSFASCKETLVFSCMADQYKLLFPKRLPSDNT